MKPSILHGIFVFTQTSCCGCRRRLPLMASAADTPSTATARKGLPDTITQTSIWLNRRPLLPTHDAGDAASCTRQRNPAEAGRLEKKTGKKPNVVVFLLDDVAGWMLALTAVAWRWVTLHQIRCRCQPGADFNFGVFSTEFFPTRATILTGQYSIHHGILMRQCTGNRAVCKG